MTIKSFFVIATGLGLLIAGCGSNQPPVNQDQTPIKSTAPTTTTAKESDKGIGKFTNVELTHPLDQSMIGKGQPIYESKCFACHKLTDEKLVGPGWKGITDRRKPEWIMNFIINTNVMLDSDLVAQSEMVTCLVRMPDQNLSDTEARQILEFMRNNDGKK